MRVDTGSALAVIAAFLFAVLVRLAIVGAVIWTAVHFLRKWW